MSQPTISVALVSNGEELPSIYEPGGRRWVVAEPGVEFVIQLTVLTPRANLRFTARVDGQDPGYTKLCYVGPRETVAEFEGFLSQTGNVAGMASTLYRAFKCAPCIPSAGASTVSLDEIKAGKIEVLVEEVRAVSVKPALSVSHAGPADVSGQRLPDGKKGFLAPGVKTDAGAVVSRTTSWDTTVWERVRELPSITLKYDSSEALLMRKLLNVKVKAHRDILRNSANPSIRNAIGPEPDAAPGSSGGAAEGSSRPGPAAAAAAAAAGGGHGGGGGRVKREGGGVKREREEGGEDDVPRSATAFTIDLTEQQPAKPMQVNGRELNADELAVCDLADSDDEGAPKWGVAKKQQVALDA